MNRKLKLIMAFVILGYSALGYANASHCPTFLNESLILADARCFHAFVSKISGGDKASINLAASLSGKVNHWQSVALRDALVNSLLSAPVETLEALRVIDVYVNKQRQDSDTDRMGTESVCATLPDPFVYNKSSFLEYAKRANKTLKETGKAGELCLSLVNGVVDEVLNDEKRGRIKWGAENYSFN